MKIEILDAVSDAEKWRQALARMPEGLQDVYFVPEYVAMHRFVPEARALMFKYERSDALWLYAFIMRPITTIGKNVIEKDAFDIETPYGYGGPLSSTEDNGFITEASQTFMKWCMSQGVVAEFARLHPLIGTERWLGPNMEFVRERENVSLSLALLDGDILPFDSKARNMLKRAERLEIHVAACSKDNHFGQFVDLYLRTMEAIGADEYYFFSDEYFQVLKELVSDSGWLLVAEKDQTWLAAAVFLKGAKWVHYHLSASDPAKRLPGSTNLILYRCAEIAKSEGLEVLHLGGGRPGGSENDPLLKFKKSMATDSHDFYIGKRIHNAEMYTHLRELWKQQYPSLVPLYGNRLLCYHYSK